MNSPQFQSIFEFGYTFQPMAKIGSLRYGDKLYSYDIHISFTWFRPEWGLVSRHG